MEMDQNQCKFQKRYPYLFSNICCWYALELTHRGNSNVHLQHIFFQKNAFFTIYFLTHFAYCFSEMGI